MRTRRKFTILAYLFLFFINHLPVFGFNLISQVEPSEIVYKFPFENGILVISYANIGTPLDRPSIRKNYIRAEIISGDKVISIGSINAGPTEIISWDGKLYFSKTKQSGEYIMNIKVDSDGENPDPKMKKLLINKSEIKMVD